MEGKETVQEIGSTNPPMILPIPTATYKEMPLRKKGGAFRMAMIFKETACLRHKGNGTRSHPPRGRSPKCLLGLLWE